MSPQQAAHAMDELMSAAKLYDRYLELSGVADVASFQAAAAAAPVVAAAPRPMPLTLTFVRR